MTSHAPGHAECEGFLRGFFADRDTEVSVSTAPFLVATPYLMVAGEPCSMTCPHGVTFYFEPTSDQIARWATEGVA